MLSNKIENIKSDESKTFVTNSRLESLPRIVKTSFVKENDENLETLQAGMAVTYTNTQKEELFGFLFAHKNDQNFTILPVNEDCLDKIHNHNAFTSLRFKNAQGSLKKSNISMRCKKLNTFFDRFTIFICYIFKTICN